MHTNEKNLPGGAGDACEPGMDDLLVQAPVAMALLGPDLRFLKANRHWRLLADRHEIVGARWDDVFPALAASRVPALLHAVLEHGKPQTAREVPLTLRRHGQPQACWLRLHGEAQRDSAGRIAGVLMVATDVTDEVRSRHALETAFKERQRLAVELERASRARHEFLAMLVHELRNPLAPIVSALELMQLKGAGDTQWEQDVVRRQVERLTRLLDDLLGSRGVAPAQVALQRQPVEIADMLAEAADMSAALVKARNHRLVIEVERGRLACRGDPLRLAQAVAHLLNNAARYTPPGGRIEVRASRDHDHVVIRVKDSGCGIAPELLPRVFELFFQGPQGQRPEGGMGVGLAITKNLVELHGGTVSAASEGVDRGAEFVVRLPRMTEVDAVTDWSVPGDLATADGTRRLRILVVDDDEDAAASLAALLRLDGHYVVVALTPEDALAAVPPLRPHVALLDIGLPGMSGHDLGVRIRELLAPRTCRLIAVTGYGQEGDRQRSAELGFVDHLVKPVNHERLLRQLAETAR
jgi:signal transduction histidine kinase